MNKMCVPSEHRTEVDTEKYCTVAGTDFPATVLGKKVS
jgi:hypothetical protein